MWGLCRQGCTPGGSTSNLYAYFSKGDVALSVTMTVVSTLTAFAAMAIANKDYASGTYTALKRDMPTGNGQGGAADNNAAVGAASGDDSETTDGTHQKNQDTHATPNNSADSSASTAATYGHSQSSYDSTSSAPGAETSGHNNGDIKYGR